MADGGEKAFSSPVGSDDEKVTGERIHEQPTAKPEAAPIYPSGQSPFDNMTEMLQANPLRQIGYEKAARMLERLRIHQRNTLENALKEAECELRLRREREEEAIQRVRNILQRDGLSTAEKVRKKGEDLDVGGTKHRVQALILYRIAWEKYQEDRRNPDDVAKWIQELVHDIFLAAYDLAAEDSHNPRGFIADRGREWIARLAENMQNDAEVESPAKIIAVNYGENVAEDLLHKLQGMQGVTPGVLSISRAECLFHIGNISFRLGDFDKSIAYLTEANQIYSTLRLDVDKRRHSCVALWVMGNSCFRMTRFSDAEEYYRRALSEAKKFQTLSEEWMKIFDEDLQKSRARQDKHFKK